VPAARRPRHAIGIGGARAEWLRDWGALRPLASPRYAPQDGLGDAPALLLGASEVASRELTHAALAAATEDFAQSHPGYPQSGDLFWSPADWTTAAGLLEGLLPAWQRGQPLVAYDGDFDAAAAVALIARYEVRNARLTPQQLDAMMKSVPQPNQKYDCRLRTLATGGAPLDAPLAAWVRNELGVAQATPA
jgi:acetyl-CoA synthetase